MSSKSIVDQIRHYQKDIERCPENSERMIRCIQRLYVLPVLVQHLQETGVGRSVNALRKFNGEVGEAAKALVTKWKAMVAAEESDDGGGSAKESDAKKEPPKSQNSENGTKHVKEDKSKHENTDSRHSSHKRSHSSGANESKAEKKSSSSSTEKSDRKSNSSKHRHHDSKDKKKDSSFKEESRHSKSSHSSSKDGRKSMSDRARDEEDDDSSPSRKKRKKSCVKERRKAELQEATGDSSGKERDSDSDRVLPELSDTEDDRNDGGAEASGPEENEDSSRQESSSDESEHRYENKSSEHHKSKSSSHSERSTKRTHHKENKSDCKRSSSSKSSHDLDKLIRDNEKKIKKEKMERMERERAYDSGGSTPKGNSSPTKQKERAIKVKAETNDDGSIDAGSGFSFADALAGIAPAPKKKKKVKDDASKSTASPSSSGSKEQKSASSLLSPTSLGHSSKSLSSQSSSPKKHSDAAMPDLLRKPIKLENLDLDINSTLPEINPNYRPLPHVPEPSRRNSTKTATNEEEMFNMMMIKNQRTKVFSGGKSSHNTQVPSLYDLCIKLLYDNIDGLEYTGGVPFDLLKPLMEKLNPEQLFIIEHYNPYLIEDTGTLWEFHCKKDFRRQKREDMESWRDLYIRCIEEREQKLKALTQNITQSIAASTPIRKAKLAYVDSAVKPPRNIAKKQARYGTGDGSSIMKAHSAEKREILNKAVVGGHSPTTLATTTVPPPPQSSGPRANWSNPAPVVSNKKRKAPLMAKALQLIKGASRFKR